MVTLTLDIRENELPIGAGSDLIGKNVLQLLYLDEDSNTLYQVFAEIENKITDFIIKNSQKKELIDDDLTNRIELSLCYLSDYYKDNKPIVSFYDKNIKNTHSISLQSATDDEINLTNAYMYDSDYTGTDEIIDVYNENYFNKTFLDFYDNGTVITDDKITSIIPRELFTNPGSYLYIGKEYGFYVNNQLYNLPEMDEMYCPYNEFNDVEVFVFDIEKQMPNSATSANPNTPHDDVNNKEGSIIVKPIIKIRYRTIYKSQYCNGDVAAWEYKFDKNLNNVILPNLYRPFVNLQLFDVGFRLTIANTDKLNYNQPIIDPETNQPIIDPVTGEEETNYNVFEDYGSFFTKAEYISNGRPLSYYQEKSISVWSVLKVGAAIVSHLVPEWVSAIIDGAGYVGDIVYNNLYNSSDVENSMGAEPENPNPLVVTYYSTAQQQISNYHDFIRDTELRPKDSDINSSNNKDIYPIFDTGNHSIEFKFYVNCKILTYYNENNNWVEDYSNDYIITDTIRLRITREIYDSNIGLKKLAIANYDDDIDEPNIKKFYSGTYVHSTIGLLPEVLEIDNLYDFNQNVSLSENNISLGDSKYFTVYPKYNDGQNYSIIVKNQKSNNLTLSLYSYIENIENPSSVNLISSVNGINPVIISKLDFDDPDRKYFIKVTTNDVLQSPDFDIIVTKSPSIELLSHDTNNITVQLTNNNNDYSAELFIKIGEETFISLGEKAPGETVNYTFTGLNSSTTYNISTYSKVNNGDGKFYNTNIETKQFSTINRNTSLPSISLYEKSYNFITVRVHNYDPNEANLYIKKGTDNWISLGKCAPNDFIEYTFSNLNPLTSYLFSFYAKNDFDASSAIDTVSYSTTEKQIPTPSLSKTINLPDRITVKVTNKDTEKATLYIKKDSGSWISLGEINGGQSAYRTFTGLNSGTSYLFTAKASNGIDISSNEIKRWYSTASGGISPDSIEIV